MKLLPKSQIVTQKASERKVEVEEGMKLARRVDVLRTTAAEEEKKLKDFRDNSLKALRDEMSKKQEEKDALSEEIEELKVLRAQLLKPLDDEWEKVDLRAKELEEVEIKLLNQADTLINLESKIADGLKEIKDEKQRLETRAEIIKVNLEKSRANLEKSETVFIESEQKATKEREFLEGKALDLARQNAELIANQIDVQSRRKYVDQKEKELNKREKFINDKYQTLLRTINRNGKRGKRSK